MDIIITNHAVERYQERVENVPRAEVKRRLTSRAVAAAVSFGAPVVKLATGHRVVIVENRVVTVHPPCSNPNIDRRVHIRHRGA